MTAFALALAAAALAALVLARGRHRGALLALALRAVGLGALVALALVPPRPPDAALAAARGVALVADGSASMALGDRAAEAQRAVATLGAGVASVFIAGEPEPAPSTVEALATRWPAEATRSRLVPAVARALGTEPPPAAVVVVTDGELDEDPAAVQTLPADCPPVRVVLVGARPTPDVALGDARIDPLVFAGASARVTARVRGWDLARPHEARVTAVDVRGVPLATARVELPAGSHERVVTLDVTLDAPGPQRVRLTAGEPTDDALPGNATADLAVAALRDRLRVLLLAGRPSFDLRALRLALRAHQNLDLVSFYILRTEDDLTMASSGELSLIPFPTDELFREHLGSFDAVFMHDMDPEPYGLDAHMPALARYVHQGGALAVVGATGLSATTYRTGALAALLPVVPAAAPPDPRPFVAAATPATETHAITRDLARGEIPLAGAASVASVAPDATTLLAHPALSVQATGAPSPVLSVRRAGAGRVLVLATDSAWRLGFPALATGGDPERLAVFWDRVLAWLVGEAGGTLAVAIEGRRIQISGGRPGETVELDVERRDGSHALERLALDAAGEGSVRADRDVAAARARATTGGEERVAYNAGPEAGDERAGVARDAGALRALVARCGGAIVRGARGAAPAREVERAAVARGMARPWLALALSLAALVALGAEWLLRRSRGER